MLRGEEAEICGALPWSRAWNILGLYKFITVLYGSTLTSDLLTVSRDREWVTQWPSILCCSQFCRCLVFLRLSAFCISRRISRGNLLRWRPGPSSCNNNNNNNNNNIIISVYTQSLLLSNGVNPIACFFVFFWGGEDGGAVMQSQVLESGWICEAWWDYCAKYC